MTRRSMLNPLTLVSALVAPLVPTPPGPDLREWRIDRWEGNCKVDCMTCGRGDFDARWVVCDRVTNVERFLCRECLAEFRRHPVRFVSLQEWRLRPDGGLILS